MEESKRNKMLNTFSKSYTHRRVAMASINGDWNLKLPWVQTVIGDGARLIYVVRDPRSWVFHIINNQLYNTVKETVKASLQSSQCLFKKNYAWHFESVRALVEKMLSDEPVDPVVFLSNLWYADTITTLHGLKEVEDFIVVRIEDVVLNPQDTAEMIFSFVGTPLSTASLHRILQLTRSNFLPDTHSDELRDDNLYDWKKGLSKSDIRQIEDISNAAMIALGYERLTSNESFIL